MVRGELLGSHWSLLSTLRRADHLTGCVGHARNSERLDSLAPAHFGPLGSTHLCRTHPGAPFASGRCGRPRREPGQPPTPHRPSDWARSQAALARRAMIASRVSSLAAESETNQERKKDEVSRNGCAATAGLSIKKFFLALRW
jgi:hypothetical protein